MPLWETLKPSAGMRSGEKSAARTLDARKEKRAKVESLRTKRIAGIMKQCRVLLKRLMSRKQPCVSRSLVDAIKMERPDYHNIMKQHMDLEPIKKKLDSGAYSQPQEFAEDVRLILVKAINWNAARNAEATSYNGDYSVYELAVNLRSYFEAQWKPIDEQLVEHRRKMEVEEEALAADN